MRSPSSLSKGFTLVELLATIAIMAVLVVAALPYVADYTTWARATAMDRDAQVVAGAISRWIAVGGSTSGWSASVTADTTDSGTQGIITALVGGYTVGGNKDPFLAPNTSATVLNARIRIGFTNSRNWTVTGRSN